MATIDGRYILAEKEDLTYDVEITSQPVERGVDITDHVQRKARTLAISGLVAGADAAEMHRFLTDCQDKGKIVSFVGRTTMRGLLSGLSTSRDYSIADGFTFSATITEVLIATTSFAGSLPLSVQTQAGNVSSAGLKQTKNTGGSGGNGSGTGNSGNLGSPSNNSNSGNNSTSGNGGSNKISSNISSNSSNSSSISNNSSDNSNRFSMKSVMRSSSLWEAGE